MKFKLNYRLYFILILLATSSFSIAQIDTTVFNGYIKEFNRLSRVDLDSAEIIIDKATKFADSADYQLGEVKSRYAKTIIYSRKGEYQKSIDLLNDTYVLCTTDETKKMKTAILSSIANDYVDLLEYDDADQYFELALQDAFDNKDSFAIAKIYFDLATKYEKQDSFQKSIEYYHKTIDQDKANGDTRYISANYNNIAIVLEKIGDYEGAKQYLLKSIAINKKDDNKFRLMGNYSNLGEVYDKMNRQTSSDSISKNNLQDSCLIYFEKAYKMAMYVKSKSGQISTLLNIGTKLNKLGRNSEALEYLDKAEILASNNIKLSKIQIAKSYVLLKLSRTKESITLFKKMETGINPNAEKSEYLNLYKVGVKIYEANNDFKSAYEYQKKAFNIFDTLNLEKQKKIVLETEAKFQSKIQKAEIQRLERQQELNKMKLKNQRLLILLSIAGLFILGLLSFFFYNRAKQRKQHNEELKEKYEELKSYNSELIEKIKNQSSDELLKQEITLANKDKSRLKLGNIVYFESKGGAILIHTKDGSVFKEWRQSLKNYVNIFQGTIFRQIHRSYLINDNFVISHQNKSIVLKGNIKLPIGKIFYKIHDKV